MRLNKPTPNNYVDIEKFSQYNRKESWTMSENRKLKQNIPVIGDVFLIKFEGTGNEQNGWRPGVVFQNNIGNAHSPNIIALPLTSAIKKSTLPTHVIVYANDSGLLRDSMVLCENPERVSKARIGKHITRLSDEYMKKIAAASLLATSAVAFLTKDDLIEIWKQSLQFNCVA